MVVRAVSLLAELIIIKMTEFLEQVYQDCKKDHISASHESYL